MTSTFALRALRPHVLLGSLWTLLAAVPAEPPLTDAFAAPPASTRILKIIHGWPDASEAQDALIDRLKRQGFGGVVCNVSFDQYLEGDPQWRTFARAVQAARQAGFALWLYDERGYPSGNAGGLVLREHPEWEARGLLVAHREVEAGPVTLEVPPGALFLAAACPVRDGHLDRAGQVDLSARVREGRLEWQAPAGRWLVLAITESRLYEGTHADGNLWQKLPYINLLQPEPSARFIEVTHQRYAEKMGPDLSRWFEATFTDEPSLMSCFLKPMPYRPLPWAANLPGVFHERRGYALDADVVLSLVAEAGPESAKHRHDFWRTVGELVSENFFGQLQAWGRRHGVPSGGHLLMEESLVAHVPFYGDFFQCARRLDAPSIDCLTSLPPEVPWYIARLLASAAELEGRTLVMSETSDHGQVWRPPGDTRPKRVVTEAEIRGTCNRLIVSGVNCITSYYSFTDLPDDALRRLNDWVGRGCAFVRGGHQVADVALLYPVESLWTRFTPARHWANEAPGASRIENAYRAAAESLFATTRDFTIIDSRAVAEATVDRATLVHGPLRWRVVVLPGVDTLPQAAWENLARFVRAGGVVIALGARPANSESAFPSPAVAALATELFGPATSEPRTMTLASGGAGIFLPYGSEGLLPLVLQGVLEADVQVKAAPAGGDTPVRVTHRRIDAREHYLVINDSAQPWAGELSFAARGEGEVRSPATGQRVGTIRGHSATLQLEPYGAALVRFAEARVPERRPVQAGPLPTLTLRRVPRVEPTTAGGEFVRAQLAPEPAPAAIDAPLWQVNATLTRGQVDTFLFADFAYPQGLDLSDADCVVLDSRVPDGQATPTQLLVILSEEGGEDFLANTGRSLAAPGRERSYIPLRQFQRAGWSKPGNGVLDAAQVRHLRIGWGGYLGTEGEGVRFNVALPQLGRVGR